jgi:bifunctional non-homologous end joining protein LigD
MARKTADPLGEYKRKRDFKATPEPAGRRRKGRGTLVFVVQKHRATRLHYDFRLEANGVLASWAVPKGPSLDPGDKRLAMHVEDHPFEYRTFEGIIPEGHYGAGEVIVWDEGTYELAEGDDPAEEIAKGKIKFILHGHKLKGEFTLVKMRGRAQNGESGEPWLLIKDKDPYADPDWDIEEHPKSVRSRKTIEELAHSRTVKKWISPPKKSSVKRPLKEIKLPVISGVQLATATDAPFDDPSWLFEIKWDGFRALATIGADGSVKLVSRNGKDLLGKFPELQEIGSAFRSLPIVVDGEIVSLDEQGRSSFQRLQNRIESLRGPRKPAGAGDVCFAAFDVLFADGRDVRPLPLEERKRLLERLIVEGHRVVYSKHVVGDGTKLFELAEKRGLEGIMAKRRDAPYESGKRTRTWLKIKAQKRQEFVIGGYTEPRGSRKGFGALIVGYYDQSRLLYAGHVGTGFDNRMLAALSRRLHELERPTSPFATAPPKSAAPAHWVSPELVCEVRFTEWTDEGYLRQPAFLGLREDKDPKSVVREAEIPHGEVA